MLNLQDLHWCIEISHSVFKMVKTNKKDMMGWLNLMKILFIPPWHNEGGHWFKPDNWLSLAYFSAFFFDTKQMCHPLRALAIATMTFQLPVLGSPEDSIKAIRFSPQRRTAESNHRWIAPEYTFQTYRKAWTLQSNRSICCHMQPLF